MLNVNIMCLEFGEAMILQLGYVEDFYFKLKFAKMFVLQN